MCSPSSCSHTEPLQEVCHVGAYRHTSSSVQPTNAELWVWWEFFCRHQNIYFESCICSWEWNTADVLIYKCVYVQDSIALCAEEEDTFQLLFLHNYSSSNETTTTIGVFNTNTFWACKILRPDRISFSRVFYNWTLCLLFVLVYVLWIFIVTRLIECNQTFYSDVKKGSIPIWNGHTFWFTLWCPHTHVVCTFTVHWQFYYI